MSTPINMEKLEDDVCEIKQGTLVTIKDPDIGVEITAWLYWMGLKDDVEIQINVDDVYALTSRSLAAYRQANRLLQWIEENNDPGQPILDLMSKELQSTVRESDEFEEFETKCAEINESFRSLERGDNEEDCSVCRGSGKISPKKFSRTKFTQNL